MEIFSREVSPPTKKRKLEPRAEAKTEARSELAKSSAQNETAYLETEVPSPIQLTRVNGVHGSDNLETVSLHDILGHPLIKECWAFNYLTDVDFLLSHFDQDIRRLVSLTVVHGFWQKDDSRRSEIDAAASQYMNVKTVPAYLRSPFGTHHSKMIILFRHDDLAQVVILTANFIERDWAMCQAVWRSPLLPLNKYSALTPTETSLVFGTGDKFKTDLLKYLASYDNKLKALANKLREYDFSEVKAALIASVPCEQDLRADGDRETLWGWPALLHGIGKIPIKSPRPRIVAQVSSIATLGKTDKWLREALFASLLGNGSALTTNAQFSIVFPTAADVRRCVMGYSCGASIHMKVQSQQQIEQLGYMKPLLCRWAAFGDARPSITAAVSQDKREAGRRNAGPHIKSYLRFTDESMTKLEWAMMTSANISKQAWGFEAGRDGKVKISSYEIGVIVWPALWQTRESEAEMVPTFKTDRPVARDPPDGVVRVGYRMPFDLPIVPYSATDIPWQNALSYSELDSLGTIWPGR